MVKAKLPYLGDQFSCQTFVNQLRSERRVEDGENIVRYTVYP